MTSESTGKIPLPGIGTPSKALWRRVRLCFSAILAFVMELEINFDRLLDSGRLCDPVATDGDGNG
jgi:hypothetical protein